MENLGRLGFFVGILLPLLLTSSSTLKPNEHLLALRNKLCFLKRPSTESKRDTNSSLVSLQVLGNLYGLPSSGKNFSKAANAIVLKLGYKNTPYDPRFSFKWIGGMPILVVFLQR